MNELNVQDAISELRGEIHTAQRDIREEMQAGFGRMELLFHTAVPEVQSKLASLETKQDILSKGFWSVVSAIALAVLGSVFTHFQFRIIR